MMMNRHAVCTTVCLRVWRSAQIKTHQLHACTRKFIPIKEGMISTIEMQAQSTAAALCGYAATTAPESLHA